ncbi:MAG: hypothetical protein GPJ18_11830 [Microcystis aeruginosa F13-15]|nr:hypothetical protein [Microcystis aeruginosa F13-15]
MLIERVREWGVGKWGSGEVGKWGVGCDPPNPPDIGGEVGKWGSGEFS